MSNTMRACMIGLGLTAACARPPEPAASPAAHKPVPVRTASVERDDGARSATVAATVHARDRAALSSRVAASVVELPYREGDVVHAGVVVARLHDAALRSGLEAAQAAADAASRDRARVEALLARGAATSREADDSRSRAAAADAGVAAALDNLEYAVLRAPFDGTIAARHVDLGDVVSPGRAILEIEGSRGLEIRAAVEPELAASLRPGAALEALVDGQPASAPVSVLSVSAAGDPATHRFELRASLPERPGLRSGLFARLRVPLASGDARLCVPAAALVRRGGLTGVFVVADARARLRWVAAGAARGEHVEVRSGVAAGEQVVLGPGSLEDGALVSPSAVGGR